MEKAFYMVWRAESGDPVKKHETIELAREEARRLARLHPCIEFFVLRAVEGWSYRENPWRSRSFCKE
uniref:Uncharacterized protein n=1 Tax=viral metagenome TaxID=1070528 RepID=A0A6M3XYF4_9ZZZZ